MLGDQSDSLDAIEPIRAMLNPRSIAVIGASNRMEYGGRVVANLKSGGFPGEIYPVNPKETEIQGLKAYADVRDIPGPVDMAVIVVPARAMLDVVKAAGEKGIRAGVVISAGFAERGADGIALQRQVVDLARSYGMRLSGPNSLGVSNLQDRVFATGPNWDWSVQKTKPGPISVVSQSGALAFTTLLSRAQEGGVGFRHLVSVGNQADLTVVDFIEYLVEADEGTKVIAVFLEGLPPGDGKRFMRVARRAAVLGKPILVLKVGRSDQGRQAALSHTAALVGKDAVYEAAFRQCAVVRVADLDDLWEAGYLFSAVPRLSRDGGVGVLSNSGGMNSLFADICGEAGVPVPPIGDATTEEIERLLAGRGSAGNPVDASGQLTKDSLHDILRSLQDDPQINLITLALTALASGKRSLDISRNVCAAYAKASLPFVVLWASSTTAHGVVTAQTAGFMQIREAGIPMFQEPTKCARALRWLRDYHAGRQDVVKQLQARDEALSDHGAPVTGDHVQGLQLLSDAGIPVAVTLVATGLASALECAGRIGYPVVLKIDAPELLHKTEVGGVELNVGDAQALASAYANVWGRTSALGERRRVLVQQQVSGGVEFILGGMMDPVFGPVVMLGAGGVWVEVADDISLRVAPVDADTAKSMLAELKSAKLLQGLRGQPPRDADALIDALVRFSRLLVSCASQVAGLEVNPILVLPKGQGVRAVDMLVLPIKE